MRRWARVPRRRKRRRRRKRMQKRSEELTDNERTIELWGSRMCACRYLSYRCSRCWRDSRRGKNRVTFFVLLICPEWPQMANHKGLVLWSYGCDISTRAIQALPMPATFSLPISGTFRPLRYPCPIAASKFKARPYPKSEVTSSVNKSISDFYLSLSPWAQGSWLYMHSVNIHSSGST